MRNLPPGRTARLWLKDRIAAASRAVDVLEQKAHALVREQRRLRQHVEETGDTWQEALRTADRWFLRATVIGGSQQLELARSSMTEDAEARVRWRSLMGVTYPAEVEARTPERGDESTIAHSSALAFAADAYRRAVELALDHAAAVRALELVEDELALTRRRLRGLENRWLPHLNETLHDVELSLGEKEREEMVRANWVAESEKAGS